MQRSQDFVTRKVFDRTLLMPLRAGGDGMMLFELNSTAGELWDFLEVDRSEEELIQYLMQQYEITALEAKEDLALFVADLNSMQALI